MNPLHGKWTKKNNAKESAFFTIAGPFGVLGSIPVPCPSRFLYGDERHPSVGDGRSGVYFRQRPVTCELLLGGLLARRGLRELRQLHHSPDDLQWKLLVIFQQRLRQRDFRLWLGG